MLAIRRFDLRCRLKMLTWLELARVLPAGLQQFLREIANSAMCTPGRPLTAGYGLGMHIDFKQGDTERTIQSIAAPAELA
jgi:hypothetical protein